MTTQILRTSERKTFKSCPQKWWWSYREGLRPVGREATPLWFGTGVHLALERWYVPGTKRGIHPAETFEAFAKEELHSIKVADATDERAVEYVDGAALGVTLLEEYVKHWGDDSHMEIIQPEHAFELPIPWPGADRQSLYEVEDGDTLVEYHGRYDGVYRDLADDGKFKVLETKTAKSISTTHLNLDDQAGSYWAIANLTLKRMGILGKTGKLSGITYNFLRKALPDERPRDAEGYYTNKPVKADFVAALEKALVPADLKMKLDVLHDKASKAGITVLGERSKVQPAALFERHDVWRTQAEQRTQLRRIQDEAMHMRAVRDGLLPVIKNTSRECNFCQFRDMCELQERNGDWKDLKRIAFRQEDPYAGYRKSAEE